MQKPNKSRGWLFIILFFILVIVFFPKKSEEWSSADGQHKSCKCLGIETTIGFSGGGGSSTLCFGLIHNCKQLEELERWK